ncbi:hypothetical protein N7456_003655 [Penicillium angulare]|uniref:Uncharacterized protein n=1 Tax=Penicillium angulare TaxID=116970 RepID=A0A9W9KHR5_9EURO|nr:hypothetical protein N7456_003655 [Penicillium angulare]
MGPRRRKAPSFLKHLTPFARKSTLLVESKQSTMKMEALEPSSFEKNVTARWINLPDPARFLLPEPQARLAYEEDFPKWESIVLDKLGAVGCEDLVYSIYPRPAQTNIARLKWERISKEVKLWLAKSIGDRILSFVERANSDTEFADEFMSAVKQHCLPKTTTAYGQEVATFFSMSPSTPNDLKRFLRDYAYKADGLWQAGIDVSPKLALWGLVTTTGHVKPELSARLVELIEEKGDTVGLVQFHDVIGELYCSV